MIQSNRYAVETKEGNFDLFITGIVEEDAGTYICQINSEPMQNIVSHCCCLLLLLSETTTRSGLQQWFSTACSWRLEKQNESNLAINIPGRIKIM